MPSETDVRAAYQFFLGRPPESEQVVREFARLPDLPTLFDRMVRSAEFLARWRNPATTNTAPPVTTASDAEVIARFGRHAGPGEAGFVTDFLGTRTRTAFVGGLAASGGAVWEPPTAALSRLFTVGEWAGSLRSVLEADPARPFVVFELGAGWAPWCVAMAAACRKRGVKGFHATAVEASAGHVEFARRHFADNGVSATEFTLLHAAVTVADGPVTFPHLDSPADDYGAAVDDAPHTGRPPPARTVTVPGVSIPTLLRAADRVDLMHIDIQGGEAEVVRAGRKELKAKVHRLVIGTHGRGIEHELLTDLSADGWLLEHDEACGYALTDGRFALHRDGCQVWRNPAI